MSRLDEIETFVAIVDAGSLTAAARRSGLALSAVSRRLRDLEMRLGGTLVHRSTRRLSLSSEGRDFYMRAKQILADLDDAETQIRDLRGQVSGRIRIAAPVTFSVLHLTSRLTGFMRQHPDVEIDLDLNDRQVDLVAEGFDLAIRIGRLTDSALIARKLTRIRHVPAASPGFLNQHGMPSSPEALADYPMLTYGTAGQTRIWTFTRPNGTQGSVGIKGVLACNNGDVLTAAAVAGLGIAIEPTFICSAALQAGQLRPLFPDHIWSDDAAFAVFPESRAKTARVRALVDYLAVHIGAEAPWDRPLIADHGLV